MTYTATLVGTVRAFRCMPAPVVAASLRTDAAQVPTYPGEARLALLVITATDERRRLEGAAVPTSPKHGGPAPLSTACNGSDNAAATPPGEAPAQPPSAYTEPLSAHPEEGGFIQALRKLLTICAWCKRIRDERGDFRAPDGQASRPPMARFTHSICPDCQRDLEAQSP